MSEINLDLKFGTIANYPKLVRYELAVKLGKKCVDFIGIDLFCLLLDGYVLNTHYHDDLSCISDNTYTLHATAKALEGFLKKIIKTKRLKEDSKDEIGDVFGRKSSVVKKRLKNKHLISKVKYVWGFCRNDVMHYSEVKDDVPGQLLLCNPRRTKTLEESLKKFYIIVDLINDLHDDLYGKDIIKDTIILNKYIQISRE